MKGAILLICVIFFSFRTYAQNDLSDIYHGYFKAVEQICKKDNGKLWGINLYSPILCIDSLRNVWSNEPDNENKFVKQENIYRGKYPIDKSVANSITEVYGKKWVMVMVPLPEEELERNILFTHEIFHYWQDSLKLISFNYNNAHLEQKDARIWLKMEWLALSKALLTEGEERRMCIEDALCFRAYRRSLYPDYVTAENAFEIHEGIPQYTGMKLCIDSDSLYRAKLDESLEKYLAAENLVRSYAYHSGSVYGYLLDQSGHNWRKQLNATSDLGSIVQKMYETFLPVDIQNQCEIRKNKYSYARIEKEEQARDKRKQYELAQLKTVFQTNCITLPLRKMNISFNPNRITALEGLGTVYKEARIVDEWGILNVFNIGCLINDDWKSVTIPLSDYKPGNETKHIITNDWQLDLNEGFILEKDSLKQEFTVR